MSEEASRSVMDAMDVEWPVSAEGIVRMEVAQVSDKEAREFKSRSSPRLGCEDGWGGGSSGGSRA